MTRTDEPVDTAVDTATDPVEPVIRERLQDVYDPCCRDKGISVVDMGLLHRARIDPDGAARVELLLTSGWCPFASSVLTAVEDAVTTIPGVTSADVEIVWDEAWTTDRLAPRAREQLRFLPDPGRVSDPAAYREKHWTSSRPEPQEV